MNKEEIFNEISSCFKMSVDMNGMKKLEEYITNLQQENEKLNHYKLLYQKVKERNDKAIEYLENNRCSTWYKVDMNTGLLTRHDNKLLELLKGESNE